MSTFKCIFLNHFLNFSFWIISSYLRVICWCAKLLTFILFLCFSLICVTYTRAVLYRRIWTESTFMSHVSLGGHISFTLNMDLHSRRPSCVNFECLKTNVTAIKSFHFPHFSSDFRFRWRTSSCQHTDKHPQLPSQPPADAEPYHASLGSHGHSAEWVQSNLYVGRFSFYFPEWRIDLDASFQVWTRRSRRRCRWLTAWRAALRRCSRCSFPSSSTAPTSRASCSSPPATWASSRSWRPSHTHTVSIDLCAV